MDDMIIESYKRESHVTDLEETFTTLKKYNMKLNPKECSLLVQSGRFTRYVVD